MNTLGKLWVRGFRPFEGLELHFEEKKLKSFEHLPKMETMTDEVIKGVVEDLISQKMITFFDDIPLMTVFVEIHDIPSISEFRGLNNELVYIETIHYQETGVVPFVSEDVEKIDRNDCDVPKPLHEFMGLSEPIMLSDI